MIIVDVLVYRKQTKSKAWRVVYSATSSQVQEPFVSSVDKHKYQKITEHL